MSKTWSPIRSLGIVAIGVLVATTLHPPRALAQDSETAIFAGGCFWCMEEAFEKVEGVRGVVSGYTGGVQSNPSYEQVSSGGTGHFESIEVEYEPTKVSYNQLLEVFWHNVDPTDGAGQFCDKGSQYRSAIFYHDDGQKETAEDLIKELNAQKIWDKPIVTEVAKLDQFYMAEDYHQEYFARNPYQPYCQAVVAPKVVKFRKHHLEMLKKQPA